MSNLLIILRTDPYEGLSLTEAIDMAFAAAAFDLDVTLCFQGSAVMALLDHQQSKAIGRQSIQKKISALPVYGIEHIWAIADADIQSLFTHSEHFEWIDKTHLKLAISQFDEVQVF